MNISHSFIFPLRPADSDKAGHLFYRPQQIYKCRQEIAAAVEKDSSPSPVQMRKNIPEDFKILIEGKNGRGDLPNHSVIQ